VGIGATIVGVADDPTPTVTGVMLLKSMFERANKGEKATPTPTGEILGEGVRLSDQRGEGVLDAAILSQRF